jgi:lipopolysaccharide/colanic/teichoic acid biosynthesis glycosyltransferase/glycosyltransferase involved in cell wall biosynthesis
MISVVVPVRNAAGTLGACLEALAHQTVAAGSYEIIVVNDGSTDNTRQVALDHHVCCLDIAPAGPAAARNHGVAQAGGELVLFTDSDCAPAPDWIEQMSALFADPEVVGARGVYRTRQTSLVARFVQQEYQDKYDRTSQRATIDFIDTYSAGYRRAVFQANGGFETAFSAPSVEDQEFSFRLAQKGYKLLFAPRAAVYHQHDSTLAEYGRRKFWIGYWKAFLLRWLPEKALGDSHTPLSQRVQMGLAGLAAAAVVLGLAWHPLWWGAAGLLAIFFATALPFFFKLWQRDRAVLLVAPLLLLVRAGALGVGLAVGLFGLRAQHSPRHAAIAWPNQMAKRLIDIAGAGGALIVSAPLLAGLVVLVKLDSPGPAFYVQERVGENGRHFRIIKLRSMVAGADQLAPVVAPAPRSGSALKTPGDPRVTGLGRILRRWSLDELPQFWNVLKGDMSLVGPRPEETRVVAQYSDWHRARLAVRPGLTGPMQINGRGDLALDDRVRLELDYIEHYSLLKDFVILLKTIPAVIRGQGAY